MLPEKILKTCLCKAEGSAYGYLLLFNFEFAPTIILPGDLFFGLPALSFLSGKKHLVTILNRIGYGIDYDLLLGVRKETFLEESKEEAHLKIIDSLMIKLVWDKIDAELTANHLQILDKLAGYHGTLMQSQQCLDIPGLFSAMPFGIIDWDKFPTTTALLDDILRPGLLRPVQDWNTMVLSLVASFSAQLVSTDRMEAVSLEVLVRLCLKGYAP